MSPVMEKYFAQERAEGRAEGRAEERVETIQKLIQKNQTKEFILDLGYTEEEYQKAEQVLLTTV